MKKGEVITSRTGIGNVLEELYGNLRADDQCKETELEIDKNETENDQRDQSAGVEETKEVPEFTMQELQAAMTDSKKRKSSRQQRNQSRRHQNMPRRDKRNGEADLQRSAKTKRLHTRGMAKNKNKSDFQKGWVTWRMLVTTAQFVLYQRCTNCFQRSCTTDFTPGLTADSQQNREGSGAHIKLWIIL